MDLLNCTPEQWNTSEDENLEILKSETVWNKIPLLNANELHNIKDSHLVKFRGMIQDMHGPELYLEKFEIINEETSEVTLKCGKYIDIADCKPNETINVEGPVTVRNERQTYVVISIPAVNDWVKNIEREKYKIETEKDVSPSTSHVKRSADDAEEDMETDNPETETSNTPNKKQCTQSSQSQPSSSAVSTEHLLNFPIPDSSGKVCHLKIYKGSEMLKLNSVCEFVGFLSVDPTLAYKNNDEGMEDIEFQTHNPPPSLIPRIHCVAFKSITHNNPLVDNSQQFDVEKMQVIRKELLILLTQLMLGDEIAAEYLIYHLISEVYLRKDFMALGKLSLNISNVPLFEDLDFVQEVYKFIELLVTKSHYIAMSLENMNEMAFVPKKDYKSNRLTSSILQLSTNTHLTLDETKLSAGKLNEAGVNGIKALSNAIKHQKTMYDFTFYQIEFDCDLPFLVFSEGKSMLPSDSHIILQPDEVHLNTFSEILDAARHFLKPELLNDVRIYLTQARMTNYEISDNVEELVQNEFVNMRQKGKVLADDLHNLLVLARLVCISQGKNTLDSDCWKRACALEEARKERIKEAENK